LEKERRRKEKNMYLLQFFQLELVGSPLGPEVRSVAVAKALLA
jgi:hypothetical protein